MSEPTKLDEHRERIPDRSVLYESVYEEAAALRRLVALADAMFVEMRQYQQAESDAFYFIEFGHNGPSVAGALDGADRAYVYHRHREGRKLDLPDAMTALGQRPDPERWARTDELRDRMIARIKYANRGTEPVTPERTDDDDR